MAQLATIQDRLLVNDLGIIKLLEAPRMLINPNQTIQLEFNNYIDTKNNDILVFYMNISSVIAGLNILLERVYEVVIQSNKQTIISVSSDVNGYVLFTKREGFFAPFQERIIGNTISGSVGVENFVLTNTKYYKLLITNLDTLNVVFLNAFIVYLERQI